MNSALKKELSLLLGIYTIAGAKWRTPGRNALMAAGAAGLFLSYLKQDYNFTRKTVFITGGSRGLGLSLAWNFLKRGADVALVARDAEELSRARDILLKSYPNAKIFLGVCDVTKSEELKSCFEEASENLNGIDIVVNNAGAILVGPFASMEIEDFEAQMRLHLYAAIETTKIATAHFKTRGGGRILNICSLGGKVGVPHMAPYDASKFALAGFAQGVRAELAADKIVMTTVYPTVMRTGSPIQAVFKGDQSKEFRVFETLDRMPLLSMSADTAAKKILDALAEGKSEYVLSAPAQMRIALGSLFPETVGAVMALAASFLPCGKSTERKTGADSTTRSKPNREEMMYNQHPHHDPEFALGLNSVSSNNQIH